MAIFEQRITVHIMRGLRAFVDLKAGVGFDIPAPEATTKAVAEAATETATEVREGGAGLAKQEDALSEGQLRDIKQAENLLKRQREQIEKQSQRLSELRALVNGVDGGSGDAVGAGGVNPENIVWMFSDGRSGSTWLVSMMEDINGYGAWREPNVGTLFGHMYYSWSNENQRGTSKFILGANRESWLNSIRNFVLAEARSRFVGLSPEEYLVIKEPYGSLGAPLLMQALPESQMLFLVRDPRDVVASALDGSKSGGWKHQLTKSAQQEKEVKADIAPDAFIEERAKRYRLHVGNSREAYESHQGVKAMVRYEDLRVNTLVEMKRIYSELDIPFDEEKMAQVVEKRSWSNIPEERKGAGKFARKASPGGWREDLTPEQIETIERITAPILREFYPAGDPRHRPETTV